MARYALVIGIGDNLPPFKSLTKTVGDAKAIAQVLQDHGGFHIELLTQPQQVQSRALVTAIQTFVEQRATGDEALIYYTGHGFPLVKDFGEMEAFLAPADCGVSVEGGQVTAQRNGLSMASLNRLVARANFSNLVMLLDCCHSGSLLGDALLRKTPRLTIVTTMRADFVEPWLAYGTLTQAIQSQAVYLGAMNREGLEAAITNL